MRREEQPVLHVNFEDNSLLPLLFGEHDRHLAKIEQSFDVRVASRGNVLAITGPQERAEEAKHTFERLYDRLVAENMIAPGDMDLLQLIDDPQQVVDAIFDYYEKRGFAPDDADRESLLRL